MKDILNDDNNILPVNSGLSFSKCVDKDKLYNFADSLKPGVDNYAYFQNYSFYKWPYWLYNTINIKSKYFNPVTPFLLLNRNRSWISFSARNSSKRVQIDPAGMISTVKDKWSIEFWISIKDKIFRPQESIFPELRNDADDFVIKLKWKEPNFEFSEFIYRNVENQEEFIAELNTITRKSNVPVRLLIVIRPYNANSLGGIESIEFKNKSRLINIDGYDRLYLENKPDIIFTGNAFSGDIDIKYSDKKTAGVKCKAGMATMAIGYNLGSGNNNHIIRIGLNSKKSFSPVKTNYLKCRNQFIEHSVSESQRGLKLVFPDKVFQKWIYGSKMSALNFLDAEISAAMISYNITYKSLYYIISGFNRAGLFDESLKVLNYYIDNCDHKEKIDFSEIQKRCHLINSVSDYFRLSRDIEYIKLKYQFLRNVITPVLHYSQSITNKKRKYNINSIENYFIEEYHVFDIILISFSLFEFSYMARCLGIFSDELKYGNESSRLEELIIGEINKQNVEITGVIPEKEDVTENSPENAVEEISEENAIHNVTRKQNEYFSYAIFAGYPFEVRSLSADRLKSIIEKTFENFNEDLIYFKSQGGCDLFFSIIFAINLLKIKDKKVHVIIEKLFDLGKFRYALPELINPKTGNGIHGEADSVITASALLSLLRSVVFMDSQEILEIFPVPKEEWFAEGSEIKIDDAPSMFGNISFQVLSTKSEVQFYFLDTPKYIPPNMMINLPFKTKIKQEDDFIIKKEIGNSFLLHGWPSIVRFIRK